jgi:hypothetical protein
LVRDRGGEDKVEKEVREVDIHCPITAFENASVQRCLRSKPQELRELGVSSRGALITRYSKNMVDDMDNACGHAIRTRSSVQKILRGLFGMGNILNELQTLTAVMTVESALKPERKTTSLPDRRASTRCPPVTLV